MHSPKEALSHRLHARKALAPSSGAPLTQSEHQQKPPPAHSPEDPSHRTGAAVTASPPNQLRHRCGRPPQAPWALPSSPVRPKRGARSPRAPKVGPRRARALLTVSHYRRGVPTVLGTPGSLEDFAGSGSSLGAHPDGHVAWPHPTNTTLRSR
ncbi:hypothetical protein NDU88_007421 [Pleurodeles waltl]|uniref:Uncharacterized protein n=1 Tax=Pleurodeles waltl TaxID=8319 RepID=A0AAV7QPR3_PLEWA|nr:hypothetical protein NDU88_007421 [Pleurodeles waltl]